MSNGEPFVAYKMFYEDVKLKSETIYSPEGKTTKNYDENGNEIRK